VEHIIENPFSALWLDMGLGKTAIALTAINHLQSTLQSGPAIVLAPKRVCSTVWRQEAQQWSHLKHLRFSLISGNAVSRTRAYRRPADIYLCNYENVSWLVSQLEHHYLMKGKYLPFNLVVYDEVTKMKHHTTARHKAWMKVLNFMPRRVGLTGTPASQGYDNLMGQYLAIDGGMRLGQTLEGFRNAFMFFDGFGHKGKYLPHELGRQRIEQLIGDITVQMSAKDYLEVPQVTINDVLVELGPKQRAQYTELDQELFLKLDSTDIEVFNAASLSMKTRQFANGALYHTDVEGPSKPWSIVHELKYEALDSIIEEANGRPVLVAYQFKHDAERIKARYPGVEHMSAKLSESKTIDLEARWNRGEVPILIGHPQSMGHGLNLQRGPSKDLVFLGLPWSLEDYLQSVARLARQGGQKHVTVHRILARNTTDVVMRRAIEMNDDTQEGLKQALNEYRRGLIT
jgi:SNF2 family DNA or RNA helicase